MAEAAATKEVAKVTMTDGRVVEFAGKRKMLKEIIVNGAGKVAVRFDFRNGEVLTCNVPSQHFDYAAGHGYAQKLGDQVAGLKTEAGTPADEDDMFLEIESLNDRLTKEADWNQVREGGGFAGTSVLMRAMVEYTGKTVEDIKAFLSGKSQAEKIALRNSTRPNKAGTTLKSIVERLEAEKAAKGSAKVDTGALLDEALA